MRISKQISIMAGILQLVAPVVTPAFANPLFLARTEPWQVDFDKNSCHLIGQFGRGDDQVILRLTRSDAPVSFQMTFAGKRLQAKSPTIEATIDFGSPAGPIPITLQAGRTGSGLPVLQSAGGVGLRKLSLPPANALDRQKIEAWAALQQRTARDDFAQINHIVLSPKNLDSFRLETGSLAKPLEMVDACVDNLVQTWGYDPVLMRSLSKRPEPLKSPGEWIKNDDYPRSQAITGDRAIVRFRLDVSEAGKVTGCNVLSAANSVEFNRITCEKLRLRARFSPALDAAANPVKSYWQGVVFFAGQTNFRQRSGN